MRRFTGVFVCGFCVLAPLSAQSLEDLLEDPSHGLTFYSRTQGSSNQAGLVTKLDTNIGYNFSPHFGVDFGVPVYFVYPSTGKSASILGTRSRNGLGNVYLDLRYTLLKPVVNFVSYVTVAAPTGDRTQGFSTGHVTWDWHNHVYRTFGRLTPFVNAGLADTIMDSPFYLRPFSSLGLIGHFEGGATYNLWRDLSAGGSFYAITPSGDQNVISKLSGKQTQNKKGSTLGQIFEIPGQPTLGPDSVSDRGFSVWCEASATSFLEFDIGYSHSTQYSLDSLFFGVGLNWKPLLQRARGR
jgi:hypothetical protein